MRGKVRVALVQNKSAVGDSAFDPRDDNLESALPSIRRAAEEGADLVLFGEMYLTGYRTDEYLYKYATNLEPPDAHLTALIQASRESRIHIIIGAATFGNKMPGDVYNSALVLSPDQGLIGVYRKTHVAALTYDKGVSMERCFYSPGKELPVFDTSIGRIGVHICYDIAFPEVARVQALKGADYLVNVSASTAGWEAFWEHFLYTRAVENAIWYVVCSVVGEQRSSRLFGGSRVVDPTGEIVADGRCNEEDFLIADIDPERQRFARSTLHILNTRQPELYAEICKPTANP